MLIVCDFGSCHNNNKEYLFEMIDRCSDYGVDVCKIQLFGDEHATNGNIKFNRSWWKEALAYAHDKHIGFTASVFDKDALDLICNDSIPFIKFAKSHNKSPLIQMALNSGHKVVATYDVMDVYHGKIPGVERLYTITHEGKTIYPVPFNIDFDCIFKPYGPFDGFSSHCLGIHQELNAADAGASILEVHFTLGHADINCPDTYFAKRPKEIEKLVKMVKK